MGFEFFFIKWDENFYFYDNIWLILLVEIDIRECMFVCAYFICKFVLRAFYNRVVCACALVSRYGEEVAREMLYRFGNNVFFGIFRVGCSFCFFLGLVFVCMCVC